MREKVKRPCGQRYVRPPRHGTPVSAGAHDADDDRTRVALADVAAGRVLEHEVVRAWADGFRTIGSC